ncbi:aminoglycoside phosphotransferase family protein [Kitasatospora sp. NBC_01560]|uniref:aminoglycoside phosphotransferase family protein n=1 Tax=Kitasatospora sp. NBC_01560 TaxID=2975965 RepID=UPI00386DC00E
MTDGADGEDGAEGSGGAGGGNAGAPEIDGAAVRALLREQHPDLAGLVLRAVDGGWDNQVWRLGEELAVRLPRTTRAPALLEKERQWLPVLAPRLPLPVPVPVRAGRPSAHFPRPWTIAAWVAGEPADLAPVTRGRHAADQLAGFLGALHREAPADAPRSPYRGGPLAGRADDFERAFRSVLGGGSGGAGELGELGPGIREVWEDAVRAPEWSGPAVWLHADLHPANVVVADGTLAGVLDFGDLCAGDPATDLAAAWMLLPAGSAAHLFDVYAAGAAGTGGRVDGATLRRARGWAVLRGLGLLGIGRAGELGLPGGKPTWGPAGRATLDRVLASARDVTDAAPGGRTDA